MGRKMRRYRRGDSFHPLTLTLLPGGRGNLFPIVLT